MKDRLDLAIDLARRAGAIAAAAFASHPGGGGMAFARATNEQVERMIVSTIRRRFPRDTVYGEEFGTPIGDPLWVIDPIDGLVNFGHGTAFFCVSIAVVTHGQPQIGVIFDPTNEQLFVARAGQGAQRDGQPLRCAAAKPLRESCICVGFAPRSDSDAYLSVVRRLAAAHVEHRLMGASALELAYVADGRFDGFYEPHLNSWDALAGLLLMRESGVITNDFLQDHRLSRGNYMLAAIPSLWDSLNSMLLDRAARDAA